MIRQTPARVKQSVYLGHEVLAELLMHAERLDRPVSWLVQRCVRRSLDQIRAIPHMPVAQRAVEDAQEEIDKLAAVRAAENGSPP